MIQTLWIDRWIPPSVNQLLSLHWSKRSKLKQDAYDLVAGYSFYSGITKASGRRRVTVTIVLPPRKRGRPLDAGNIRKVLDDAMVKAGLLIDDSPAWLEEVPIVWERSDAWGTKILLEDVE